MHTKRSIAQIAETISQMQTLFQYSQQNPLLQPSEALHQLVASFKQNQAAQLNLAPNNLNPAFQQPHGPRTPSFNGTPQFASPAAAHLNLPTSISPAMSMTGAQAPSPAQNHNHLPPAAGVAMVAQQSQQGTNTSGSQGTSANTSPNATNKRRRPSTVKVEGDDGGGGGGTEVNGTGPGGGGKVKPSPRIGGKRQKAGS